jgi:hypothetical protein
MFRRDPDFARLYMPFQPLLFFADAGNGDQFAFVMRDRPTDVFVWDHESDSRQMVAPRLATYLEWWLDPRVVARRADHRLILRRVHHPRPGPAPPTGGMVVT